MRNRLIIDKHRIVEYALTPLDREANLMTCQQSSLAALCLLALQPAVGADAPRWETQEIDPKVGNVCYAITVADVNGDKKPDVVAVTEDAVVWYENPSWRKRDIIRGATERDNVCIAAQDIDGDGRIDFALGAGWRPADTTNPSTLQWLGRDQNDKWQVHAIQFNEPSMHRIRWADVLGNGKKQLVVVPLQGRGTKGPNWGEGPGVNVLVYSVPSDPKSVDWPVEVLVDTLHTIHGFQPSDVDGDGIDDVLLASWEGVFLLKTSGNKARQLTKIGEGYQAAATTNKGASEVKMGKSKRGDLWAATIEPWHGHQVVLYVLGGKGEPGVRHVLADGVTWGHAVWFADLDADGSDELIIGQRDPRTDGVPPKGPGVWIYDLDQSSLGGRSQQVSMQIVDDGGMACEDACAADLDGDGRPELVAGGRATHNVRVYWNRDSAKRAP